MALTRIEPRGYRSVIMGKSRIAPPARLHGPAKGVGKGGANGKGWGGPANGPGVDLPQVPIERARAAKSDPIVRMNAAARRERDEAWAEEMRGVLYRMATEAESEQTRVIAAEKLLDRIEGKAIARNLNINNDVSGMTLEQVEAEIARLDALADSPREVGMETGPPSSAMSH